MSRPRSLSTPSRDQKTWQAVIALAAAATRFGDVAEARAIRAALGDRETAVYAPKSAPGQSMGAAGAIEAILTVQALRDGFVSGCASSSTREDGSGRPRIAATQRPAPTVGMRWH
jgi:3-oxoacyl-(acyl-carrier-protein) synthase